MSIQIKILLFAGLRERAGAGELLLELRDGATPADARAELEKRFPGLLQNAKAAAAVNGRYARDESAPLKAGDELAFLPPVSGG
ncbi:MAG: MoaD/ThiS family protein [Planctomycetes bacterium]|nr:MoaD/ThiS family protein [Planctomycetota bacterium]